MIDDAPLKDGCHVDIIGIKRWFLNNRFHREDGPAVIHPNGDRFWLQHGHLHREDGPAIEYVDYADEWYVNGKRIDCKTQEEFKRLMRLKAFW